MGRMYPKKYYRKNYVKPWVRREVWERVKTYCLSQAWTYSECLEKLLEKAQSPCVMSKEMEELIELAVRLANKYPNERESQRIFKLWELIIG